MRLGAPVYGYSNADEWVNKHIEKGYGAAYWPINSDAKQSDIDEYLNAAKAHDLVIAEVPAWCNLLDENPVNRQQAMDYVVRQLQLADYVGARCCINLAGSKGVNWHSPHPDNLTEKIFNEVVEQTRSIIDRASPKNTYYTLECMPFMYPYSTQSQQQLIESVSRPKFGVHADLCNLINSFDLVYHTDLVSNEFLLKFDSLVRSVHAKDIFIEDALTLKICETPMGQGIFDQNAFLSACNQLDSDLPVMLEHLEKEQDYDKATEYIRKCAEKAGIEPIRCR